MICDVLPHTKTTLLLSSGLGVVLFASGFANLHSRFAGSIESLCSCRILDSLSHIIGLRSMLLLLVMTVGFGFPVAAALHAYRTAG